MVGINVLYHFMYLNGVQITVFTDTSTWVMLKRLLTMHNNIGMYRVCVEKI